MSTINETETAIPCLIAKCDKEARWKGLCSACYGQAKQLIDAGETTWEELAALGLAVVPDKPFVVAFKAARSKSVNSPQVSRTEAQEATT